MANTQKYLNHLLQNTGITPACSEEERAAADIIAKTFSDHGFEPQVQEFSASGSAKVVQAGLGIAAFVGAVLMGIGGIVGVIGLLLALAAAVLFTMERNGRPILSQLGAGGLSQNVIAYHKASGPLASPRNRPVVVVAHYDSPRADLLCQEPYASYRPLLVKLLPFAMLAPAVIAVVRLLPIPDAAKIVLWILAIVAALIPLANAVAIIANRFVLPYTTGAVCNKASVAAMLGVMDAVSPYQGAGEEFSEDVPFDEYFAEQQRIAEEAIAAAEAAAAAEMSYPHEGEPVEAAELAVDAETAGDANAADAVPAEADAEEDVVPEAGATATFEAVDPSSTVSMDATDFIVADESDADEVASEDEPAAEDVADSDDTVDEGEAAEVSEQIEEAPEAEEPEEPSIVNAEGNYRFGAEAIRGLGMLPAFCSLVYEEEEVAEDDEQTAFDAQPDESEGDEGDEPLSGSADEPMDIVSDEATEASDDDFPDVSDSVDDEDELPVEDENSGEWTYDTDPEPIEVAPEDIEELDDDEPVSGVVAEEVVPDEEYDEDTPESEPETDAMTDDVTDDAADSLTFDESEPAQDELPVTAGPEEASADQGGQDADAGSTQMFQPVADTTDDPSHTIAMPARPVETVDSLMAEISSAVPAPKPAPRQRTISVPSTTDAPTPRIPETANRASLFDLPDPSAAPVDPFASPVAQPATGTSDADAAAARSAFTVIGQDVPAPQVDNASSVVDRVETISAPAPAPEKKRHGLGRLFGRKKKHDDSMSEWLGVEDGFDAERDGANIGSWDNFDDDDSGWKGGATGAEGVTEDELRDAITSMGDDELLGHDIWFVATGASENGNAGMQAFLNEHRDKLRGVFLINLECVGAGQVAMLATEGERRVFKGDKRIMKLVSRVSADFHHEYGAVDMPYVTTDANPAMSMSLRSLTLGGIEESGFALGHTEADQPFNVDAENVELVSDVVTEVIRRS